MSLVINHNLMAMNAARSLNTSYGALSTATQRLSSGLRINSAADDAAGLAIRELMRCDISTLNQGIRNANDAVSMIQTADGALQVVDEKLIRMKELAEQAATGTYTSDQRIIIDSEYQAMASEITRIASATDFNGIYLLNGNLGSPIHNGSGLNSSGKLKVHFGTGNSSAEDYYYIQIEEMTSEALGLGNNSTLNESLDRLKDKFKENLESSLGKYVGDTITQADYDNLIANWPTYLANEIETYSVPTDSTSFDTIYATWNTQAETKGYYSDPNSKYSDVTTYAAYSGLTGSQKQELNYMWSNAAAAKLGAENYVPSPALATVPASVYNNHEDEYLSALSSSMSWYNSRYSWAGNSIQTQDDAQSALDAINNAIVIKDKARANLGALQNRLENTISNLETQAENLQAAESQISDVDVATEMTEFVRQQIISQSAAAMLTQANSFPKMALQLIQG